MLVGYLSQYFCEKSGLEEELSILRNGNDSELVTLKEEEIKMATKDAYMYALGMIVSSYCMAVNHTWVFHNLEKIGMIHRIVLTGAIFQKVCVLYIYLCKVYAIHMTQILRLTQSTIGQLSIGHIVNLASNDVQKFNLVRIIL